MSLISSYMLFFFFFFQAEDGIRDLTVTGVQTCALPISVNAAWACSRQPTRSSWAMSAVCRPMSLCASCRVRALRPLKIRSEEHTSELQSQSNLVCRLLLEKKKTKILKNE